MKTTKQLLWFCFWGFVFVCAFGTLTHFLYEWSNKNVLSGILFPTNESTWEHLKMSILPTLVYFVCSHNFVKNKNYSFAMFICLLTPMILIPAIFYSHTAISQKSILVIDILTFFVSVFVGFFFAFLILKQEKSFSVFKIISIIGIIIIIICYLTFTLFPPKMFLFQDITNGKYGLIQTCFKIYLFKIL